MQISIFAKILGINIKCNSMMGNEMFEFWWRIVLQCTAQLKLISISSSFRELRSSGKEFGQGKKRLLDH